jgi:hypothetical protein
VKILGIFSAEICAEVIFEFVGKQGLVAVGDRRVCIQELTEPSCARAWNPKKCNVLHHAALNQFVFVQQFPKFFRC